MHTTFMKNKDFIANHAAHIRDARGCYGRNGRASCSHVYCEGDHLESYGSHYPLLWRVASMKTATPLLAVNARGYSVSTSRHISDASRVADITVYSSSILHRNDAQAVIDHLREHVSTLTSTLNATRAGTKKAEMIASDIARVERDIAKLEN
jgi:hypothetical protein